MKKQILVLLPIIYACFSISCSDKKDNTLPYKAKIDWLSKLSGNYSFREEWSYGANIYRDGKYQLREFDNAATENMIDANGKIYKDSIEKYYQLLDTTHYHFSIECKAKCYEWTKSDYIVAKKYKNIVRCYTLCDISTHSSLELIITKDICIAQIAVKDRYAYNKVMRYKCKYGSIKIEEPLWKKGILKAEFSFTFDDPQNPKEDMWWKGKIYTKIYKVSKNRI